MKVEKKNAMTLKCKGVFSRQRERFAKDANVEKMAKSNVRILGFKSSPNMRGGSEASIVREILETFARNFKLYWKSREQLNPRACLANFWNLKYEC